LVLLGLDVPKELINTKEIGDKTKEYVYINAMPPPGQEGSNLARSGWVFMDTDKSPDWSWPDYTIAVGTVEVGRHAKDITEKLEPKPGITDYLVSMYESYEEETGEEE